LSNCYWGVVLQVVNMLHETQSGKLCETLPHNEVDRLDDICNRTQTTVHKEISTSEKIM